MSIATLSSQITIPDQCRSDVQGFLLERLRNYYLEQGFSTNVVNAVFAAPLTTLDDLRARLNALAQFLTLPVAQRLVATNKRIGNILRKSKIEVSKEIDEDLLSIDEERQLFEEVIRFETALNPLFKKAEYDTALEKLASLDPIIAAFFDAVMVMDDDPLVRNNRLALLARLKGLFDTVADLSKAT